MGDISAKKATLINFMLFWWCGHIRFGDALDRIFVGMSQKISTLLLSFLFVSFNNVAEQYSL